MIARLRDVRLSRLALAVVAALSGLATAVVITTALGRTSAQSAATEALRHPPVVVRVAATQPVPKPAAAAPVADTSPAPAPVDTSAASDTGAQSSAPAATSDSSSGGGDTSAPTTTSPTSTTPTTPATPQHKVGHVFEIALSTTSFEAAFGQQSVARYLNAKLRPRGTFLGGYETLARAELPDYLAQISGQAPNDDTL